MADLRLRTMTRAQGANAALLDGTVRPAGAVLDVVDVPVLVQGFRRMVRSLEFDVCEMAVTTYLVAKEHGVAFTALPVFLVRGFHHGAITRHVTGDLRDPQDLVGRRVGVNRGYTVTTGVWARGILAQEHGVDLDRVTWLRSGDEHVAAYRPPANVGSAPEGVGLPELLASGDLAAAVGAEGPDLVPLLPDPEQAGLAALRRDGFWPVNHLVVVRDEVLAEHPDLAVRLFEAFAEAKDRYLADLRAGAIAAPTATDRLHRLVLDETGDDPLPHGLEPNRAVLERLLDHATDQHILTRRPDLAGLFAPGTLELSA